MRAGWGRGSPSWIRGWTSVFFGAKADQAGAAVDIHPVLLAPLVTVSNHFLVFVILFVEVLVTAPADMIRMFHHLGVQTTHADLVLGEYGHDVLGGKWE